jgi:alcohol dehydrogenase (cytochrome c)
MLSLGEAGNQQATPLVNKRRHDRDLAARHRDQPRLRGGRRTGRVLWKHETKLPRILSGLVKILSMNRGAALYGDRGVLRHDGRRVVVAVQRRHRRRRVADTMADYKDGYFFTMAPLAADGKIIVAAAVRVRWATAAFIAALDATSGRELWRTYTIPAAGEPGADTWSGESWKHGGGAVWLTGTYDPKEKLVFFGIGNPAPWDANLRKGKNLYTNSAVALDVRTGQMKWFKQYHGNDTWDMDTPHEHLLLTINKNGTQIPVTFQPQKTGFYFALDRSQRQVRAGQEVRQEHQHLVGRQPGDRRAAGEPGHAPAGRRPRP